MCVCVNVPVLHEGIAALTESGCDETNQEVSLWLLALDGAEKIDVGGPVGQPDPHDSPQIRYVLHVVWATPSSS